jgi:hypothetical protein
MEFLVLEGKDGSILTKGEVILLITTRGQKRVRKPPKRNFQEPLFYKLTQSSPLAETQIPDPGNFD